MPDTTTQGESLRIKGTCTASGEGKSMWTFTVEQVEVETTADSGGKAKYDSAKDKTCLSGLVKYAALKGVTFTATVGPEGEIQKCSLEDWPKTCDVKIEKGTTVKNSAADLMPDPTGPRVWLELVFHTAPAKANSWKRTLHLVPDEELDMKADGSEQVEGDACAKLKLDTADPPKGSGKEIPREQFKSGKVSFSRAAGCALKVDLKGGVAAAGSKIGVAGVRRWEVECEKRGFDAKAVPK